MLIGGAVLLAIAKAAGGAVGPGSLSGWLCMAFLILQSAVTISLWCKLLSAGNVSSVGVYTSLIPVVSVLFSLLLPDEPRLSIKMVISMFLIVAGVVFVNLTSPRKRKKKHDAL